MFDCSFLSRADFYAWAVVGVALFLVYGFVNGVGAARGLIRSHVCFLNFHAVLGGLVALYICWIWWRFNTVAAGMWFVIGNAANASGRAIFEAFGRWLERKSDAELNEKTGRDQIV